jgi:transcriptional regulator GlxA family with amidase domain
LPSPGDPRLAELFALLQASPDDRRSIVELARAVGTSPRTLARLCRDELGMTFPQWRTQIRIRHALQLLAEGTLVTVVATRCG